MMNKKISLIGAGSGCFSIQLVQDICRSKHLAGCTISLMDIDQARLDAVHELCTRHARELGLDLRIEKTLDRVESLTGADCVINTALAAPHSRLQDGWKIAQKYGFKFGGSYHVMYDEAFWINFYQLRLMELITEDILKHCPNAWHLMVANPVVAGTTHLQRKYPEAKMVGLCHGYAMIYGLAESMGVSRKGFTYEMSGVNHFVWMNRAKVDDVDFFPLLDKWVEEHGEEHWKNSPISDVLSKKRLDFYRKHGVVGIGDTLSWTGASWPWWYHSDDETEKAYGEYTPMDGWNSYFSYVADNAQRIKTLADDKSAKTSDIFSESPSDELMIPLVESLLCDIPRVMIVNTLNKGGLVPGVPDDFEVELPALCSGSGIQGLQTEPLPKTIISYILRDRVAPVEMELAAYNTGRRDYLEELVLMDKWATSLKQVSDFVDEILMLPYHQQMREHYR